MYGSQYLSGNLYSVSSLKPKILYQLAVSFLYSAAPIAVFPYISRTLGPQNIGRINFVDYAAQFFILFASFGIPLYAVREIARVRNEPEKIGQLSSEFIIIHFLFSLISLTGFGMLVLTVPAEFRSRELLLLAGANIVFNAFSLEWLLQGLEDFSFFGKRSFVIKLLSVAAVFLFIRQSSDYILYYLLLIASNVAVLVTDAVYAYKKGLRFHTSTSLKRHFKPLTIFFLTSATFSLYNYFDTVILGIISGSLAVGFYTTGLKTVRLTQNFVNDIGGVLLPHVSFLIAQKNSTEINRVVNKSLDYVLTVSIPLMVFIFMLAPEIIAALAGTAFLPSVVVLQLLSLLPLLIGLGNLFGTQVLLPFGKERSVLTGVVAGSVVSIAANIILCPVHRQQGAAIACVLAECFVTAVLGFQAIAFINFSVRFLSIAGAIASSLLFIPVIWGVRLLAVLPLFQVAIAGAGCFITYFIVQFFVFKNVIVKDAFAFFILKTGKARLT